MVLLPRPGVEQCGACRWISGHPMRNHATRSARSSDHVIENIHPLFYTSSLLVRAHSITPLRGFAGRGRTAVLLDQVMEIANPLLHAAKRHGLQRTGTQALLAQLGGSEIFIAECIRHQLE